MTEPPRSTTTPAGPPPRSPRRIGLLRWAPAGVLVATLALAGALAVAGPAAATRHHSRKRRHPHTATQAPAHNWLVYHHDAGGSGNAGPGIDLSSLTTAWTSPVLDGQLYGEPLVLGSAVFVATENDSVYKLSASNGTVLWHRQLATPVPSGDLPCGNISPTVGITSTPVIDPTRDEIFVVADEDVAGTPRHELFGLNTGTGATELSQDVDPPGAFTPAMLNRASLTLDKGNVVFGYGGNYGDCSHYHGWVVSVPETGGPMATFEADAAPGENQGAVWMGGAAPVIATSGDVWVETGNGSVTSPSGPYDDGEGVLDLTPSLTLRQYFAPGNWYQLNADDEDLSTAPAVLPDGYVVAAGKSRAVYLLDQTHLGGIGGQVGELTGVCGNDIDGGTAYSGNVVYLPCESGVMAVRVDPTTRSVSELWQTPTGAGGPPILAGGMVWTISGTSLYGLNPANGEALRQLAINGNATDFPTPSYGDGLLLAPSGDQVAAFAGPPPPAASTKSKSTTTSSGSKHTTTSTGSKRA